MLESNFDYSAEKIFNCRPFILVFFKSDFKINFNSLILWLHAVMKNLHLTQAHIRAFIFFPFLFCPVWMSVLP